MGMFDYVKYKAPCCKCGAEITEWQSKDYNCSMSKISVKQVTQFYGSCLKCHAWNEYDVIPKDVEIILNLKESKLNTHTQ